MASSSSESLADRVHCMIESSGHSRPVSELELRMQLLTNVDSGQLVNALQELMAKNRIRMVHDENGLLSFEAISRRPNPDEVVFEVISDCCKTVGGVIHSDIRHLAKLTDDEVKKALKSLQEKDLIWKTKSNITNKLVYTVAGMKADLTMTGGSCFEAGSTKAQLTALLKDACLNAVFERHQASYRQIMANIYSEDTDGEMDLDQTVAISAEELFEQLKKNRTDSGMAIFPTTKLPNFQVDDVEAVLYILLCEGKLRKTEQSSEKSVRYRFNPYNGDLRPGNTSINTALSSAPCIVCPDYQRCRPQSPQSAAAAAAAAMPSVSPETCPILDLEHLIFK